ncbi:alginate lyase family protein, partial [bacterium]|nr:alginate lyase family protein [bacterium]
AMFILNQEHFQKQFFEEMLNLDYPGLEKVKNAYKEEKKLLAAYEVAEYFRRMKHPVWENSPPIKKNISDIAADKVVRHEFAFGDSTIHFGKRIDYRNNPTKNTEWLWGLNDMRHWVTLLDGYINTSNEIYAREFNRDVIDWTVRNPAPPFRLTRNPSWRNLEAGDRMAYTWPQSFFGFLASPSFQTQAVQIMLASMWSHGQHITHFPSGLHFSSNWSIVESNGLVDLGMYFPEFKDAKKWVDTGFRRLSNQMDLQIYPDGVQHELASGYHYYCLRSFYKAYDVALKTGTSIPLDYTNTLEKMYEYLMYISSPARMAPPCNDSGRFSVGDATKIGAETFKRQDMLYIATNGKEGIEPQKTSLQFPYAGQSVMRSDWSPQSWYLFFDAGPTGVNHQHEDKLHISVSAFGRIFLTDGGKGSYIPNKWRRYLISTQAHNTIIIDGQSQQRIPQKKTHRTETPLINQWISNDKMDFASGTYSSGYGDEHIDVVHSRYIIFKKKEYWLVLDVLKGKGEHKFESLFHFTPCSLKTDSQTNTIETLFDDGRNIKITSKSTTPLNLNIIEGAENPEQGWIVFSGKRVAAPTAVFSGRTFLPLTIATVIQPFMDQTASKLHIEFKKQSNAQANIILHFDNYDDHWIINLEKKNQLIIDNKEEQKAVYFSRFKDNREVDTFTAGFGQ